MTGDMRGRKEERKKERKYERKNQERKKERVGGGDGNKRRRIEQKGRINDKWACR